MHAMCLGTISSLSMMRGQFEGTAAHEVGRRQPVCFCICSEVQTINNWSYHVYRSVNLLRSFKAF